LGKTRQKLASKDNKEKVLPQNGEKARWTVNPKLAFREKGGGPRRTPKIGTFERTMLVPFAYRAKRGKAFGKKLAKPDHATILKKGGEIVSVPPKPPPEGAPEGGHP